MRIIHDVQFTPQEIEHYRQLVFTNVADGCRLLREALDQFMLQVEDQNKEYLSLVENIKSPQPGDPYPYELLQPLRSFWADSKVQEAWRRGNEAALPGNLAYFFPELDRLFQPNYVPTTQDILQSRWKTTGITDTIFHLRSQELHLLDVGGQKSERRKWIHCFEDVTTLLFLVSLNAYDQCMVEDKTTNQMRDAMAIWQSICKAKWFLDKPMILFLNKEDLYMQRVAVSNVSDYFVKYRGKAGDAQAGKDFFKTTFLKLSVSSSQTKPREVYVHFTTATDTALLRRVMVSVEDVIMKKNLKHGGLI